ncbi:GNAT family N-acetyltransferase [Peribacillus simplex]
MKGISVFLIEWGKENGAEYAYLQVMLNNGSALRLYSKLGFRKVINTGVV